MGEQVCLLDLISCKPFPNIKNVIIRYNTILIIDEQTPYGGISSSILEYMCDNKIKTNVERLTLPDKHFFENGGREYILSKAGLGKKDILNKIKHILDYK